MPADPVPLMGRVRELAVAKTCPEPVVRRVQQGQEFRIEVTEDGGGQRQADLGVRIRRTRSHQDAVRNRHAAHGGR